MMNEVKQLIDERRKLNDEDDYNIEKCRNKLINILSQNISQTINIFDKLTSNEVLYASEIFEEVSFNLQSVEFIKCLNRISKKYPKLNIRDSIEVAEEYLK